MKNNVIVGGVLVLLLVAGGIYYSSTQKVAEVPVVENDVANNTLTTEENTNPNQKNLTVVGAESKATYKINEDLRGVPTLVTGNTNAITGFITINKTNNKILTGKIEIDANSFATDIPARDENVKKLVLESDKQGNASITFVPVNIQGDLVVGSTSDVKISGNITIKGVTKSIILEGTALLSADNTLALSVKTVLTYADFGVTIPDFPFLANIDKTVDLSVDVVAR
ncbi:MAG: YceI family protein [Candidatus Paceibacterota bacterium]